MKYVSLAPSATEPPTRAAYSSCGEWRAVASSTVRAPRRDTRNWKTLPPSVSVPSKSKAATVVGEPDGRVSTAGATGSVMAR